MWFVKGEAAAAGAATQQLHLSDALHPAAHRRVHHAGHLSGGLPVGYPVRAAGVRRPGPPAGRSGRPSAHPVRRPSDKPARRSSSNAQRPSGESRMQPYDHNAYKNALHHNKRSCGSPGCGWVNGQLPGRSSQSFRGPCGVGPGQDSCCRAQRPTQMQRHVPRQRQGHREKHPQQPQAPRERPRVYHAFPSVRGGTRSASAERVTGVTSAQTPHAATKAREVEVREVTAWRSSSYETLPTADYDLTHVKQTLENALVRSFSPRDPAANVAPGGPITGPMYENTGRTTWATDENGQHDENIYSSLRSLRSLRSQELQPASLLAETAAAAKHGVDGPTGTSLRRCFSTQSVRPFRPPGENVLHRSLRDLASWRDQDDALHPVYGSLDNVRLDVEGEDSRGTRGARRGALPIRRYSHSDTWCSHREGRAMPAAKPLATPLRQAEKTLPLCLLPDAFDPAGDAPRRKKKGRKASVKHRNIVDDNNNSDNNGEKKPFAVEVEVAVGPGLCFCGEPAVQFPPWVTAGAASRRCGGLWSLDAALAALTLAASLGNLVRLPRLVLQYGGGSFLAVYCATSLLLGVPMALLEVGLGQLCEQGVTRVWRAVPLFTGVGIVKVVLSALLAVYWPVLMALSLFFAVWTAKGPIPFSECKHRLNGLDGYVYSRTSGEACLKNTFLKSPIEEPMWFSVTATFLFLLWTVGLLCVFRGSRGYRRVLAVLLVVLVVGIVAVLVDSTLLPAADSGLELLLRFDWDALLKVETWYFATVQMFFSTHIGFGNIVSGAGRFYSKSNAVWTAAALVVCSLVVGVLWVAIVFLRLGQLMQPDQLRQLVSSDLPETLVLTLLYDAAARGGHGVGTDQIVATIAFLLIVCAGFASMLPLLDTVLSAIHVESKRHWEWWKAAAVCSVIGFVLGALCMLPEGLSLVHVLDHYVVGRLVMACSVTELVAFVWIYGCGPLYTDLEFVVGHKLSPCWKILWCIAPIYLLTVEAWSVVMLPWDGEPGRHDPAWQVLLGWGLYFAGWAIICVTALRQVCIQVDYNICQKFLSAVKPSRNWGPADPIYRHCWMQWRDATPAHKMDQTLRRRGTRDYTHSVRMASAPDPLTHLSHLPSSRGSGPFFIDSKAELAEHVCWRKEIHDKAVH